MWTVEAAAAWYEHECPRLGLEFLEELHNSYDRIAVVPLKYLDLRRESDGRCFMRIGILAWSDRHGWARFLGSYFLVAANTRRRSKLNPGSSGVVNRSRTSSARAKPGPVHRSTTPAGSTTQYSVTPAAA